LTGKKKLYVSATNASAGSKHPEIADRGWLKKNLPKIAAAAEHEEKLPVVGGEKAAPVNL
jgi:hypothetical protein